MLLTLRQLKVFEYVARHESYTRAAESLHLTQPAVSMQVRQLEEAVGLPLFEKLGKQIYLTVVGRELFHYSQVIHQQLREAEEVLESLKLNALIEFDRRLQLGERIVVQLELGRSVFPGWLSCDGAVNDQTREGLGWCPSEAGNGAQGRAGAIAGGCACPSPSAVSGR